MNRIRKFLDIAAFLAVVLGVLGLGVSAYLISSYLVVQNDGSRQTIQPVRPVGIVGDGSGDRSTLGRQQ
ncbi:hypothetical protein VF14_08790 [Nostoc linckia z18]|uniref:Uncharacterized protein n=3 Tax=Nostoc linckia TaxID=92942 RepID=A0A9Q5ZEI0_NOSLI|nr:hypothetical protein [Nostoc linckia]PHJ83613.1 hypothetical protein VF06_12210 [Nostoc linckia z4]PHJ86264.1 hypothetical protein VF07_22140 [Nostoc linckia z6]PHK25358.1 hypothetical protein VF10_07745 [Nostoc linckia z13]PHK35746.1 hypothetical protein VF14_08790 [Nostoc linckia z18]PHK42544.1 hypothetical protein VF12_02435 [Nostoc linckia z15]PHK44518.1 hypothetical protein VF13_21135 [Nostoc linckia z16]